MFQVWEDQVAGCAELPWNGSNIIQKKKIIGGKTKKQQFLKLLT
jgi:hypothetical protein